MKEKSPKVPGGGEPTPAKFSKRLQDTSTREGTMIQMKCQVTGNPEPEVTWMFENERIEACQDKRITMKAGLATLTILSMQLEDAGLYTCEISNGVGNKLSCTCKVTVSEDRSKKFGGKMPNFDKVIADAQTIPGNRALFTCIARGNPKPKIAWFHDNIPVIETENIKFTNDGNNYRLEILRVSEEDTGWYHCKATNSIGMRDCKARLSTGDIGKQNETSSIKVPPLFTSVAGNRNFKEGEQVSFEFKFTGQPPPTVVWKLNGKPILRADRLSISQPEPGTARLAIGGSRLSDCGEYTCVIYNSEGETSSSAYLMKDGDILKKPKKKPDIGLGDSKKMEKGETSASETGKDKSGKDVMKASGNQGKPCTAPLVPKLNTKSKTLSWEVETNSNNRNLSYIIEACKKGSKSKEWTVLAKNIKEPKYSIDHLDPRTDYVFRVRAETDSGISEPSEEIDMSEVRTEKVKRQESISDEEEEKQAEVAPKFLETTEEIYALDNEDATLECFFTGYPTPKITWMQDDEVLTSDDHFVITVDPEEGKTTLLVKGVSYDDIGEYECIAVNDKGYSDCRLYLDVAEPPKFVELFKSQEIPFGYSLRLDCRLDGIPEPDVVWSKDDMPLKQSGRVKFLFEGEDGASLLLENFSRTDCGEYSIRAYNIAGSITHSVMVTAPGINIEPIRRFVIKKDTTIQDDYEILEELGRGAYGIVHRAKEKQTGLERAAKFITIKAGMWDEVRNEIKIMGMLSHKRLIGLYDAYETQKEINMAMELVTGGELFERIVSQDSITEGEAVFFLKQVIDGVSHMHERNVVHLDLKPENILLESADSDNIKVIDFGLARVLKPDEEIQCACGTPEFVAPEVVRRKPITPASDVWSIGVIAYILLSGCSPFMGEDDRQTLVNVRDGDWEFEEDIWDDISEEAKDFIAKVLVVDVEERYTLKQCLEHPWLKFDERRDRGEAKISTERLKNFNSRRKWRKALNAVKSMMRLRRLSSLIRKEEEEKKREEEQAGGATPEGGDSGMASPSTSESRTPTTPRLEPLMEEDVEDREESTPPSQKETNHNEIMENNIAEEGSGKILKQESNIRADDVIENHQSEKRMKKNLSDGNELGDPYSDVCTGMGHSEKSKACSNNQMTPSLTSDEQVNSKEYYYHTLGIACVCSEHNNACIKKNGPINIDLQNCGKTDSFRHLADKEASKAKTEGLNWSFDNCHDYLWEKSLDLCLPMDEPITSLLMSYSESCEPGLEGPPSKEVPTQSENIAPAKHAEVIDGNRNEDKNSGSCQSDNNGNCLPEVGRNNLSKSHIMSRGRGERSSNLLDNSGSLEDSNGLTEAASCRISKRFESLSSLSEEEWLLSSDEALSSQNVNSDWPKEQRHEEQLQEVTDTASNSSRDGIQSKLLDDTGLVRQEKGFKGEPLWEKSVRRKSGVVLKPKLQGIIEKTNLEGEDVELGDDDIFKHKNPQEQEVTTNMTDIRRMSNMSILSDDSMDIADFNLEDTHEGRSDILAFDHSRMEARAAGRGGSDKPAMPKVMPAKMANLAHMMLKMSKEKKTKKLVDLDSTSGSTSLLPPTSLTGIDPPSPIKKISTSRMPFIFKRNMSLFGEETDKTLQFSRFDKYFLLLFTSTVVRFYLSLFFGLVLGVILSFFTCS